MTYIHSAAAAYLWYTYFQSNFSILWMKKLVHIKWVLFFFFRGWKKTAVRQNGTIWKKQQLFWFPKSFLEKWIDKDWLSSIFCQIIFMFDLSLGNLSFRYPNPTLLTTLETIFIEPFLFFPDHYVRIYTRPSKRLRLWPPVSTIHSTFTVSISTFTLTLEAGAAVDQLLVTVW